MSREFRNRDKKVHKMTKDGLVEQNLATGEQQRISQRGEDFQLQQSSKDGSSPPASGKPRSAGDSASYQNDQTSEESLPQPRKQSRQNHDFSDTPAQTTLDASPEINADAPLQDIHSVDGNTDHRFHSESRVPPPITEGQERLRFKEGAEESAPSSSSKAKQHTTKYQQQFATEAAKPEPTTTPDPTTTKPSDAPPSASKAKPPRLQFDKTESTSESGTQPDKKLNRARYKAENTNEKLKQAQEKIPQKRKIQKKRVYDEQKGKSKTKFEFEKTPLARGEARFKPPAIIAKPAGVVKGVVGMAGRQLHGKIHQKIHQVEDENVGVKAGHRAEQIGEKGLRLTGRAVNKVYRFAKDTPYRTVAKIEKQAVKANINFSYRKALADNPKLKSNLASRFMQKRKIKRAYAKAAREAKKAGKSAKKTGSAIGNGLKAIGGFVRKNPTVAGIVALVLLLLFFIMSMFGSCSNMAAGIMSGVVTSSYVAEDADIDSAELAYTQWETDLLIEAKNAESTHSGYDEYRYNIGDISHDPFELMAYLTAKYQDFMFMNVQTDLRQIFDEQYQLNFEPVLEIRTRIVTKYRSVYDDRGNYVGEESYEEEEEYEWHVLNVNLHARSFTDIVTPEMNTEQTEMFGVYMQTKGNRQYLINPFGFNWLPYVTSSYGYRIHPISGEKDYHKAIDIAVPAGTEILAGHDGVVSQSGSAGDYGLVVVLEGENGLVSKYAHCSQLLVSVGQEVKKGDVIAKVGSTGNSTGPHLHLEIIKNGQYLNPIYFAETGDDGSGRIPPGNPGGVDIPEYPGEPLGDGSFAAMMEEAEKHLGKRYVFGASGPANFDCSGFVCWVLDKSGVKPMGRTNAQGLYNMCTPVSAANARPGDLIFFTGTYSTPNAVSHIGIYIGNGQMIHCGNPISYASINSRYWQEHFYAYGRIN